MTYTIYGDVTYDGEGNEVDPMEPAPRDILQLINGPKLTHKGNWGFWVLALFLTGLNVANILFADELFRWNLSFRIRDPERAEPSEWELQSRRIGWVVLAAGSLIIYCVGLQ